MRTGVGVAFVALSIAALAAPSRAAPRDGERPDKTEIDPVVVGGTPVPKGKWQDAAGVVSRGQVVCTGTLIAPNVVLTAGHCIGGIEAVVLGVNDLRNEGEGETIAVSQEIEYPNSRRQYDLGLLILEQPSSYTPRVIAHGCMAPFIVDNADVAIVGYGAVDADGTQYRPELMEAFTVVTDADCSSINRGCESNVSPNGEIGAGGDGIDSCFGDSGGPLYLLTEHGDFLVGATSRGWDDVQTYCSEGGIYVRPDAVIDWIEETAGIELPEPTCNNPPAPTADPIDVPAGGESGSVVVPNDPDANDTHTYMVADQPEHGEAVIDADGNLTVTADAGFEGEDQVRVVVTDNGVPALSGEVVVTITITPDTGGCGCSADIGRRGGAGLLFLGFVVMLGLRRRRH